MNVNYLIVLSSFIFIKEENCMHFFLNLLLIYIILIRKSHFLAQV